MQITYDKLKQPNNWFQEIKWTSDVVLPSCVLSHPLAEQGMRKI